MSTTNTTRRNHTPPGSEATAKDDLIDQVVDAFASMRARRMRGFHQLRRDFTSVMHLQVLLRLQVTGPLPVSRLARYLGISAASATGLVGRMEERGLVRRLRDERDRRVVLVQLEPGGHSVLEEIGGRGRASLVRVLSRLGEDELAQLRNGLTALDRATRELETEHATADGACREPDAEANGSGTSRRTPSQASRPTEEPDAAEDPR